MLRQIGSVTRIYKIAAIGATVVGLSVALHQVQRVSAQTATQTPPGRLLASNCFQCHGTNGRAIAGMERLAGKSAREIYGELVEMRSKPANTSIMHVHAQGYTDAQLRVIADYLSQQKP